MKNSDIRFAFFGTPLFSVRVLDALLQHGLSPALIVTAPDKPAGRGLETMPPPAKAWASERGIDVLQPHTLRDGSLLEELRNTDWDCFAVAAYAKLIPKEFIEMPRKRSLNVHPSLLPKLRGPSPALSAILQDERASGVSIMLMDEEMDHGPIVSQASIEIAQEEWPPRGSMYEDLLATEGGNLLAETMPHWLSGDIEPLAQEHAQATYTKKFTDADARIDLVRDPRENFLKVKAFDKSPRAWSEFERSGKRLRVIIADADFKDGALVPTRVIPEGRKEMDYADFLRSGAKPAA